MEVAHGGIDLQHSLTASEVLSPEHLAVWERLPPGGPASLDMVLGAVGSLCGAVAAELQATSPLESGTRSLESDALRRVCQRLAALDAVLGYAESSEAVAPYAQYIFQQLEAATDVLAATGAMQILQPLGCSQAISSGVAVLRADILRLPALILVRCISPSSFTARELLNLGRGDLALAVAIAVAVMENPGTPPVPQLQLRMWQVLYHLSTPQCAAELLGQVDGGAGNLQNEKPMQDLLKEHVAHLHRLALCLVQFGALEAACRCAEPLEQRAKVLVACLRLIHSLTASPHLVGAGRTMGRQLAVLWQPFGIRLLAPHLRRLLSTAAERGNIALQAARQLRNDLRTLGWVLHHCPELRRQAKPLCSEIAMRVAQGDHPPETLAVAVGTVANSGALADRGPLYNMLEAVDEIRKLHVCQRFPSETNRLWVIKESWQAVEDLGFWPQGFTGDQTEEEIEEAENRAADEAAIARLARETFAFQFVDDITNEACDPYAEWDEDDDEWDEKREWEYWENVDSFFVEEQDFPNAKGPLGRLGVPPPAPPPEKALHGASLLATAPRRRAPLELLCEGPEAYRCIIDGRLCSEPVRTPEGVLYERSSILSWLAWNKVCPLTGSPLDAATLVEDTEVVESLGEWVSTWATL